MAYFKRFIHMSFTLVTWKPTINYTCTQPLTRPLTFTFHELLDERRKKHILTFVQ